MRLTAVPFILATLTGCLSQVPTLKDWADSAIGANVAELRALAAREGSYASRTGWQETTYSLPNGHWIFVLPDRPNCDLHFEVNGENVVVGYTPVGTGCRYQ